MNNESFVNRIDELLEKKGINRAKLLRETELSESTLRGWKRGVLPGVEPVYKVAQYLNVSVEYLLNGDNQDLVIAEETQPYNDDTPIEDKLLDYFRKLNEKDKKLLYSICCLLSSSEV